MSKSTSQLLVIFLLLTLSMFTFGDLQTVNTAKAYATYGIPPKVSMPEVNVNATISKVNGLLWAKIDSEYQMHTIYSYGDSYMTQNTGMGLVADPSPYLKVIVTQNTLEAHYPIPINAINISLRIDKKETLWQLEKGPFHLFGENLPQINWTISPVPQDFNMTVHYEQPISETIEAYSYLGDYAFTLPLFGRFGCSNISYPLYDWAGHSSTEYNIHIESTIPQIGIYSINNRGTLTSLNATTSNENGFESVNTTFSHGEEEGTAISGAVAVFDSPTDETENFPNVSFMVVVSTVAVVIGIIVSLLVYHKKHKRSLVNNP